MAFCVRTRCCPLYAWLCLSVPLHSLGEAGENSKMVPVQRCHFVHEIIIKCGMRWIQCHLRASLLWICHLMLQARKVQLTDIAELDGGCRLKRQKHRLWGGCPGLSWGFARAHHCKPLDDPGSSSHILQRGLPTSSFILAVTPGSVGSQVEHGAGDNCGMSGQSDTREEMRARCLTRNPGAWAVAVLQAGSPSLPLSVQSSLAQKDTFFTEAKPTFYSCHFHTLGRLILVCGHTRLIPLPFWLNLDTLSRHIPVPGADPSAGASYAVASSSAGC